MLTLLRCQSACTFTPAFRVVLARVLGSEPSQTVLETGFCPAATRVHSVVLQRETAPRGFPGRRFPCVLETYPETAPEIGDLAWYACVPNRLLVPRSGFQHLSSVRAALVMFITLRRPPGGVHWINESFRAVRYPQGRGARCHGEQLVTDPDGRFPQMDLPSGLLQSPERCILIAAEHEHRVLAVDLTEDAVLDVSHESQPFLADQGEGLSIFRSLIETSWTFGVAEPPSGSL